MQDSLNSKAIVNMSSSIGSVHSPETLTPTCQTIWCQTSDHNILLSRNLATCWPSLASVACSMLPAQAILWTHKTKFAILLFLFYCRSSSLIIENQSVTTLSPVLSVQPENKRRTVGCCYVKQTLIIDWVRARCFVCGWNIRNTPSILILIPSELLKS
jgi:hypothetical protein